MGVESELKICTRCVTDTTYGQSVSFDEKGVCNFCKVHDELEQLYPQGEEGERRLAALAEKIKKAGQGRKYDCVLGVSGGRDSTYTMHIAISLGLRPLAVHFDNGWNSEIAVRNIKKSCEACGVDLRTFVADWEEFKGLQRTFLEASVPEVEVPTDVAIHGSLHRAASEEGVRYILLGHSFRTEGIAPLDWTYMDGRYIKEINKRFGDGATKSIPSLSMTSLLYYMFFKGIRTVPILNYVPYVHSEVQEILEQKYGWRYYGGHHHESHYTHFIQSYYLPKKFGIDKRKTEYSALIRSGQMDRAEALEEIHSKPYPYDEELIDYCLKKMDITKADFERYMNAPCRNFRDYPSYYPFIVTMAPVLRWLYKRRFISPVLYFKFCG